MPSSFDMKVDKAHNYILERIRKCHSHTSRASYCVYCFDPHWLLFCCACLMLKEQEKLFTFQQSRLLVLCLHPVFFLWPNGHNQTQHGDGYKPVHGEVATLQAFLLYLCKDGILNSIYSCQLLTSSHGHKIIVFFFSLSHCLYSPIQLFALRKQLAN